MRPWLRTISAPHICFDPLKGCPLAKLSYKLVFAGVFLPLLGFSAVHARESLAIATPFEVGDTRAGNYLAALVASADKDTFAASTFFQEALRDDPKNRELIERGFLASLANGDMDAAFAIAKQELRVNPKSGLARLALAVQAIHDKKYDTAKQYLAKEIAASRDATAVLLSAWAEAGRGRTKSALAQVEKLNDRGLQIFRDYHVSMINELAGNHEAAIARLRTAYGADAKTLRLVDSFARLMSKTDTDGALKLYESFDKLLPRHPIVVRAMADLKAGKALPSLINSVQDGAAEVLYGLGAAGGQQGDEMASIIYLRLSLYLRQDNALASVTLGDLYERLKQNERAIDAYEMVPDADPMRNFADIQTAVALESLQKQDLAVKRLQEIANSDTKDLDALTTLGNLYASRKDFVNAEATYTKAIAAVATPDAGNWLLYYRRGTSLERLKKWPEAEADLKKALELFPEQPQVLNYLGYSWIDMGQNLDEGFKMLRRAVELRPNDGYIVDSLGWAQFKLGQNDEAVRNLEKAVALTPADPTVNDHLGDAYWRAGRKLEAKFQWNHARDFKPEPDDLTKILKKIENGLEDAAPAKQGG